MNMKYSELNETTIAYDSKEKFPGIFSGYRKVDNYIEIETDNYTKMRVYVLENSTLRFRYSTIGQFEDDFSYAIDPKFRPNNPGFEFYELDKFLILKTKDLECRIQKEHLYVSIFDHNKNLILEDEKGFHWEDNEKFGGDIVQMSKKVMQGEAYFGMGDKPVEPNLRGHRFMNWGMDEYGYNKDTDPLYKNINFFYGFHSNQAYGIFLDNTFKSFFDFASERRNVTSFWSAGGEMNYYFFFGTSLMNVAQGYTKLTGTAEMPPMWALGYQQCKWSYYPESNVREVTEKMRKLRVPCDAIYLDIDYMDGFRCFTWDKEKFPNPKKMIADLADEGFKTMVIIDPGIKIDHEYSVFQEAFDKGYFCKRADGAYVKGKVWPGDCYFPDFTRPEVREWWASLFTELISEEGIAGVWNDMNEPALFEVDGKTFPIDVRHDYDGHPCSHRKGHNVYGMQMTRATYDGVKKALNGKRPLIITRSGYNGLQRFSSVWTGDNLASWEHLLIAHYQTQRLNICGISFCGSDIGGFIGQPSGELYVRWMQQAVFHPFMRTHSSGDHGDQEPWSFGEEYLDYVREFINLRYQLLPYIYTCFYQYHKFGTPMIRPLQFMHPEEATELLHRKIECYFGENLIYAPVMQPGATGRIVYLPKGSWFDYYNNQHYAGGSEYYIDADLNKIPFFIKGGTVFPQFPVMQFTGERKIESLELRVYASDASTVSYLYADDNNGYHYENGAFRYSKFTYVKKGNSILITQEYDTDFKPEYSSYTLNFIGLEKISNAKAKVDEGGSHKVKLNELVVDCDFRKMEIKWK